jgi:putative methyltransferase (TIGR04325 family)
MSEVTLKQLLHGFVPPVIPAALRHPVWEGIYPHLREVPVQSARYDHEDRVREMSDEAMSLLAEARSGNKPLLWHETLATLTATVAASRGRVTIVDFGGGAGTGFIHLLSTLPGETNITYHVVDLANMCSAARQVFGDEPRIHFHTDLAAVASIQPDIVYVNSVLQYIENYVAQLQQLGALRAPWLLLARLSAGPFPTFASRQVNLPGQVLPYWFFNRDEIVGAMNEAGYRVALEGPTGLHYDQRNFPETHRIGRMRDVLFTRTHG